MKLPATGGCWIRDPKSGALKREPKTGGVPEPEAAPVEEASEPKPVKQKGAS